MPLRLVRYAKRSPHWYIRGSVRGKAVFETTGTDDKEAADAIRIKLESDILDRSIFGASATVTFAEAAISYLAAGGEARFLGEWNAATKTGTLLVGHFAFTAIGKIGQAEADAAAETLYPGTLAATRKRGLYVPLCAVLNHAARKKWCARPMISHPSVPLPVTNWSSPERLEKLLPHCSAQMRRFLMVGAYTGARLSEILRIDWDRDVSLHLRAIVLRKTKNGEMRTVHIPDPMLIELARVPAEDRHGPMFKWTNKVSVYVPLKSACKRAGVDYLPPHQQGRHTYATWLRSYAGLDLLGLKEAGGWKNIQSVVRYAHVTPGEAARAADRLPSVQNPCSAPMAPKICKVRS